MLELLNKMQLEEKIGVYISCLKYEIRKFVE
jgi:hypothetical protein